MERDLASIFATVLAAFSASCLGQPRCDPGPEQPPSVTTVSVAMVQCAATPPSLPATTAPGVAPEEPLSGAMPAIEYDPRTCEIDCGRTCTGGGQCGRDASGNVLCTIYHPMHACGRSTEGAPSLGGINWSSVFALESISAIAFSRLAEELTRLDAPGGLVEGARRATVEEERHARLAATFAPESAHLETPHVRDVGPRSLLEIAVENAREGCVRETWGAYAAASQSGAPADDFEVFARAVADEERGHAAWSWALDTWARSALSPADLSTLDVAHEAAREALERELPTERKREAGLLFALLRAHPSSTFAS